MANIFKRIGKALGISGSSSPTVVDPVAQEAEQKRLAQLAVNTQTAIAVQNTQKSNINALTTPDTNSSINTEANSALNQTNIDTVTGNRKWRILKGVLSNLNTTGA